MFKKRALSSTWKQWKIILFISFFCINFWPKNKKIPKNLRFWPAKYGKILEIRTERRYSYWHASACVWYEYECVHAACAFLQIFASLFFNFNSHNGHGWPCTWTRNGRVVFRFIIVIGINYIRWRLTVRRILFLKCGHWVVVVIF
jgi:hypothetical protein